jgi:hypothetical protein
VVLPTASRALNRYGTDLLLAASGAIVRKMRSESDSYPRPVNGSHNLQKLRAKFTTIAAHHCTLLHAGAQVAP